MENIPKLFLVLLLAGALASCQDKPANKAIANQKSDKKVDPRAAEKDAQFTANVILTHQAIIDWSIPELEETGNRSVRDMASKLHKEHTRLLEHWKKYAEKKNILGSDSSQGGVREAIEKYTRLPGDSIRHKFWIDEMLDQEKALLSRLEDFMDDAGDPQLKILIQEEMPVIRMNRDQLMMLKSKL